jgi:uncharacterized membrane protein
VDEVLGILFALLFFFGMFFGLPIASWVSARRTRRRVAALEAIVERQTAEIGALTARLQQFGRAGMAQSPASVSAAVSPVIESAQPASEVLEPASVQPVPAVLEPRVAEPVAGAPAAPPLPVAPPEAAPPEAVPPPEVVPVLPSVVPEVTPPLAASIPPSAAQEEAPPIAAMAAAGEVPSSAADAADAQPSAVPPDIRQPVPPTPPPPPPPSEPPTPPSPAFDWESLVGVKLFSAIAGVALVLAAVFFLRYSIEHGWLQPPVRVLIGIAVAVGLLVVCELKAARRYPVTANALDAAAIAILFATFFAAHALWNLIPAFVTFALLAMVTAVAVLLSIRRGSMFIAVLGLLGGFATPALLSTGENRPIPLFAYLMLLNIGLAWVAYRQTWPVLTWLTLVLTTLYQWGWVFKFLDTSRLSLAMGVFLIFPLAAVTGLMLARRRTDGPASPADRSFERTAVVSAGLPLLFAVYLATTPAYGAHASLLFGFLLLLDAGLFVIALMRGQELLHAAGALTTMVVMASWLSGSYVVGDARFTALGFTAAFVLLYLSAPAVAGRFGRHFDGPGKQARFAAPLLLFVFPALVAIEPAFSAPLPLFGTLLGLVLVIAWRAIQSGDGPLYYVAAFFAIASQAAWSAQHLTSETLRTGVIIYAIFGIVAIGTPLVARRSHKPLEPEWGGGAVLLVSLGLLLFLSLGPVTPAGLWAMALLLAIINAGLFVESAAGNLPIISQAGSLSSWLILAIWWIRAAGTIGILPSLTVLTGLTLITLGGHAWAHQQRAGTEFKSRGATFARGLYLALVGHFFLAFLALNRQWSIPPWPLFGALTVITLAISATSLVIRTPSLHAAGVIAAAVVVLLWAGVTGAPPWGTVAVAAASAVSVYALTWIRIGEGRSASTGSESEGGESAPEADRVGAGFAARAAIAAGICLFVGDLAVTTATAAGRPMFVATAIVHCADIAAILWLAWRQRWSHVAAVAVVPAWLGLLQWYSPAGVPDHWKPLLGQTLAVYAIFVAFPFVLGSRARGARDPYLAAVLASAMFFFSARNAFLAGGLGSAVGLVPVMAGGVLALMLRALLRMEPTGERDTGRLALVAGAALAFVTVAIPLQLRQQWITIGWALEAAALAWLYRRIPHRGLLYSSSALFAVVFVRLALNPEILLYEPRGSLRIFNWYLYTYVISGAAFLVAAWWLSNTKDQIVGTIRASQVLPAAGVILLFLLLNIEIADFYATGPTITFRFGVSISQDLTYTIGWLMFGIGLLIVGIYMKSGPARIAAVSLIGFTTLKCFAYDLSSLRGLYLVASLTGLALSLVLVALMIQKFVAKPKGAA